MHVFKPSENMKSAQTTSLILTDLSEQIAFKLLQKYPVPDVEKSEESSKNLTEISKYRINVAPLRQSEKIHIPPNNVNKNLLNKRKNLPIYQYRDEILQTIDDSNVVLIMAETGSGKTTQVFISKFSDCNCEILTNI